MCLYLNESISACFVALSVAEGVMRFANTTNLFRFAATAFACYRLTRIICTTHWQCRRHNQCNAMLNQRFFFSIKSVQIRGGYKFIIGHENSLTKQQWFDIEKCCAGQINNTLTHTFIYKLANCTSSAKHTRFQCSRKLKNGKKKLVCSLASMFTNLIESSKEQ